MGRGGGKGGGGRSGGGAGRSGGGEGIRQRATLTGSEKQVVWARDIIDSTQRRADNRLDNAQARYNADIKDGLKANRELLSLEKTIHSVVTEELAKLSDAKQVIDSRNGLYVAAARRGGERIMNKHGKFIRKTWPQMQDFLRFLST